MGTRLRRVPTLEEVPRRFMITGGDVPRITGFGPKRTTLKTGAAATLLAAVSMTAALAGNWPAWRGPGGNGICDEKRLPLHWSTNENVRWHVSLPDRGNSTPIAWRERVFLTQFVERDNRCTVMCFDRREGSLLWQAGPTLAEKERSYSENPPCTPSPVTDGARVVAWFGSAGVFCYDFSGRELWHRDLGRQ